LKVRAGRWRFELFYFDFALGAMAMALVCGLTFGNLGFDGFSLMDDFIRAGKRQWLYGFLAGVLFNLGNMLLVAAISITGLAVAFPLAAGFTLVILAVSPGKTANWPLAIAGCVLVVAAMVVDWAAYSRFTKKGWIKPLLLCSASGLVTAAFFPMVDWARTGEVGLGPYALAVLVSAGMLFSTFVYNLFFMNLPVEGEPLELPEYFKNGLAVHRAGLLGGAVWCAGTVASFVVAGSPIESQPASAPSYAMAQGGPLIAALWGLLVWKEFAGAGPVKARMWLALLLFAGGLAVLSVALTSAGKP